MEVNEEAQVCINRQGGISEPEEESELRSNLSKDTMGSKEQNGQTSSATFFQEEIIEENVRQGTVDEGAVLCGQSDCIEQRLEEQAVEIRRLSRMLEDMREVSVENEVLKEEVAHLAETRAANERLKTDIDHLSGKYAQCEQLQAEVQRLNAELHRLRASEDQTLLQRLEAAKAENERLINELLLLKQQRFKSTSSVVHEAENFILKAEIEKLKMKKKEMFCFQDIAHKDELVSHFTGLPNKEAFYALLNLFNDFEIHYVKKWKVRSITKENQLFLTLVKLRRGLSNMDLATRFHVDMSTVSNIFLSWLYALHHVLVENLMATIPSRSKTQVDLPECFKDYPNTRMVLDCTEVVTENPNLIKNQCEMYSAYKHRITSKVCVAIAPNGTVVFVSDAYAGSTSDRDIVKDSGILKCLVPGDSLMADKGFNIEDLLPDGVTLNIPPFKETPQFTLQQILDTNSIAVARIHIERAIARIKRYLILQCIPQYLEAHASEIFKVCAALTNFRGPLIKDKDDQ